MKSIFEGVILNCFSAVRSFIPGTSGEMYDSLRTCRLLFSYIHGVSFVDTVTYSSSSYDLIFTFHNVTHRHVAPPGLHVSHFADKRI